jgi:hypothetical protein
VKASRTAIAIGCNAQEAHSETVLNTRIAHARQSNPDWTKGGVHIKEFLIVLQFVLLDVSQTISLSVCPPTLHRAILRPLSLPIARPNNSVSNGRNSMLTYALVGSYLWLQHKCMERRL